MLAVFEPENFEKIVDRKIDFLTSEALCRSWADSALYLDVLSLPEMALEEGVTLFSEWFVSKKDLQRVESLACTGGSVASFARRFCKEGQRCGSRLLKLADSLEEKDYSRFSNRRLLAELEKFDRSALRLLLFLWPTHPVAKAVERQLRVAVEQRVSDPTKRDSAVALLSFPCRENTPVVENRELMALALALSLLKPMPKSLKQCPADMRALFGLHTKRFGFLGARGIGLNSWAEADFFRRASELAKEPDLAGKIRKSAGEVKANRAECAKLMRELRFSFTERALVEAAKEMVYFRTYRTECMYRAYHQVEGLLCELGRRFGVSASLLRQMSMAEIRQLGNGPNAVDLGRASARADRFGLVVSKQQVFELNSQEFDELKRRFSPQNNAGSVLKGTAACKGKVRGVAKILLSARQLDNVQDGDVLVASMTTPDLMPAMKRAAAFVTDEGGITCHAAIVAREMNKPCVIGTKTATKAFKDGDLVEVNGDTGLVQKV